jgi:hypothetical protein
MFSGFAPRSVLLMGLIAFGLVGVSHDAGADETYQFHLTKGHGIQVCEAYLQRLNLTTYYDPPYCGRPETSVVPGFRVLDRIALKTEEKIRMSGPLFKRWEQPSPHLTSSWEIDARGATGIYAWRYKDPIDLGNNGRPEYVLVWRGYGLTGAAKCGVPAGTQSTVGYRPRQLPLVLQSDQEHIDENKTAAIFAGLGRPSWVADKSWVPESSIFPFRPIGRSIGIFDYQGTVYFDAFFDTTGDDQGRRAGIPKLSNTLGVFVRKHDKTSEVCELKMAGSNYPTTDDD